MKLLKFTSNKIILHSDTREQLSKFLSQLKQELNLNEINDMKFGVRLKKLIVYIRKNSHFIIAARRERSGYKILKSIDIFLINYHNVFLERKE